ncbi:MAG: AAC(3) family N-acetyltransferase [Alphaproteobacteria bacterium]|nr:AAC(3) family N-acetyltransferase [Alphaproteobacteria bacterium]
MSTTAWRTRIAESLAAAGAEPGDVLFVHSATSFLRAEGGRASRDHLAAMRDAIFDVIGPKGTLLVPTFTYRFCRGAPFDPRKTPSEVGIFSNFIVTDPRAVRSFHAIFSVAALGPMSETLTARVPPSAFGHGSVFSRLRDCDAKLVFIDCEFRLVSTYLHHVEQVFGVPYRFDKDFTGPVCIDGRMEQRTFSFFVRPLDGSVVTDLARFTKALSDDGYLRRVSMPPTHIELISANDAYDQTMAALQRDVNVLLAEPTV